MEPEGSLLCSEEPAIDPSEDRCNTSSEPVIFYGTEMLAHHLPHKLEHRSLSAVRNCLFNIFTATLRIWRPSPPSATRGRAMPWWQGSAWCPAYVYKLRHCYLAHIFGGVIIQYAGPLVI
jgi:hypothetical protein